MVTFDFVYVVSNFDFSVTQSEVVDCFLKQYNYNHDASVPNMLGSSLTMSLHLNSSHPNIMQPQCFLKQNKKGNKRVLCNFFWMLTCMYIDINLCLLKIGSHSCLQKWARKSAPIPLSVTWSCKYIPCHQK